MSSSDDYHRHRLRTGTKYFKVSVKPFQRLGGVRGGSPEKNPKRETRSKWQSDSTTTGEADCLIQSSLKSFWVPFSSEKGTNKSDTQRQEVCEQAQGYADGEGEEHSEESPFNAFSFLFYGKASSGAREMVK